MTTIELENLIQNSAFNKQKYEVNIPVRRFVSSLMAYVNEDIENPTFQHVIDNAVPDFQRSNDQWTQDMQIKFVENVVKGFRTKIQLFEIKGKEFIDGCMILDGLQRTTALSKFIEGEFEIFDGIHYDDIEKTILKGLSKTVVLEVFNFNSMNEVIDFYIEMNENITHSPEDIAKALSFKTN